MSKTVEFEVLRGCAQAHLDRRNGNSWAWRVIGVFPHDMQDHPYEWWNNFAYTVGIELADPALAGTQLWAGCASVEGRNAGHELVCWVLNHIAAGMEAGAIEPGDTVLVPMGVAADPDGPNVTTTWWIGADVEDARYRQAFVGSPSKVLPILWSSPLGFPEEVADDSAEK